MMGMMTTSSGIREALESVPERETRGRATAMPTPQTVKGPVVEVAVPDSDNTKSAQMRSVWRRADILIARAEGAEVDDRGRQATSPSPDDGFGGGGSSPPRLAQSSTSGPAAGSGAAAARSAQAARATAGTSNAGGDSRRGGSGGPAGPKSGPKEGGARGGGSGSGDGAGGGGAPMPSEASLSAAAGERRLDPSAMTKRQIRSIIAKDDEGGVSGSALIGGLESNIKQVLTSKRREHDQLKQEVTVLQRQREALTLRLRDLQADGEALGFGAEADRSLRLKPVAAITRKPVFAAGTSLRESVEVHDREAQEREAVMAAGLRYQHMHQRLGRELVALRRRVKDLEEAKSEEASLERELAKRIISAQEGLGGTRSRLVRLRREVRKEKALWMTEIADQHAFLDSKAGFETFLEQQLARHQQLEQEAERRRVARKEDKARKRTAVSLMAHTGYASRLQAHLEGAKTAEAEYDDAFRRLGAAVLARPAGGAPAASTGPRAATSSGVTVALADSEVEPEAVLRVAKEEQTVWAAMAVKLEGEEDRVAQLTAKLTEARAALEAPEASVQAPRAHRELAECEGELQGLSKAADAERARLDFAHESMEPVRLGLQVLSERLLGLRASFDAAAGTRRVMQALRGKVAVLMDECRRMRAREADADGEQAASRAASPLGDGASASLSAPASPVSGAGAGGAAPTAASRALDEAMAAAADLKLSSFNVRVPPRSSQAHSLARRKAAVAAARGAQGARPPQGAGQPRLTAAVPLPGQRSRKPGVSTAAAEARALSEKLGLWAGDVGEDGRPPFVGRIPALRAPLPSVKDVELDAREALAEVGGDERAAAESQVSLATAAAAAQAKARRGSAMRINALKTGTHRSAPAERRRHEASAPALPAVPLHPLSMTHAAGAQPRLVTRSEQLAWSMGRLPSRAEAKDDAEPIGQGPSRRPKASVAGTVEGGWVAEADEDEVWDRSEVKKISRNVLAAGRRRDRALSHDE